MNAKQSNSAHSLMLQREMDAGLTWDLGNRIYRCLCCGVEITHPWSRENRVKTGAQLSDVDVADNNWMKYKVEKDIIYGHDHGYEELGPLFMMVRRRPTKFLMFHQHCYSLLLQHFEGEHIDLDRLWVVCQERCSTHYVHEDIHEGFDLTKFPMVPIPVGFTNDPPSLQKGKAGSQPTAGYSTDCFSLLPMEIRIEIAIYLATVDFLSLRYASRPMAKIFDIQSFWKSRFQVVQSRGFLAYLAINPQDNGAKDWRLIYRCTANIDLMLYNHENDDNDDFIDSSVLESLQIIWCLQYMWENRRWLTQRYSMTQASHEQITLYNDLLTTLHWKDHYVGSVCNRESLRPSYNSPCVHCGSEHVPLIQAVPLQDSVVSLAVSVLHQGLQTVITGFELVSGEKDIANIVFGYRVPGEQVIISLCGQTLRGFSIISCKGRIHALRPIFFSNDVNRSWIGQTGFSDGKQDDCDFCFCKPLINQSLTDLVLEHGIQAFRGKFDYCKMIGLSIA